MNTLKAIIVIAICAGILSYFVAWWMIAVVAFVVCVSMNMKPGKAFVSGFCGVALLWLAMGLFRDVPNEHILSGRMAKVLGLPNGFLFLFVTSILGGIVGGLSGWTGGVMNKAFRK